MRRTIVVGYDGSDAAADALALGRVLAAPLGAELVAACVYSACVDAPAPTPDWERLLHEEAGRRLAKLADGAEIRKETLAGSSPGRALVELAEREAAELLVVGSSHHGAIGATLFGSAARSLLHGAPCGVAVVPRGFEREDPWPRLIGVGFDDSAESWRALRGAIRIAESCGARLRLLSVSPQAELFPDVAWLLGEHDFPNALRAGTQRKLDRAIRRVPASLRPDGSVILGSPEDALRREGARGIDLLVLGSRSYGPVGRVLLGSVADALVRSAPCPVVVFPRGSDVDLPKQQAPTGAAAAVA